MTVVFYVLGGCVLGGDTKKGFSLSVCVCVKVSFFFLFLNADNTVV